MTATRPDTPGDTRQAAHGPHSAADAVVCTRRWYAVRTACMCPPCREANARTRKRIEAGVIAAPASDAAWAVLDGMLAQGWTRRAIASACNIPQRSVADLLAGARKGHRRRIGRVTAARILAHGEPTQGFVSALGPMRRLQALAALGWTGDALVAASRGELARMTVSYLLRGDYQQVSPAVAKAVAALYAALSERPGGSTRAATAARAKGWAVPAAWDDIDDPKERPKGLRSES